MSMSNLAQMYFQFWSTAIPFRSAWSDNLLFFVEGSIPIQYPNKQGVLQALTMPYGTYSLTRNEIFQSGIDTVRIWTRSSSIIPLMGFLDHVEKAIPNEGVVIDLPNGKGALALYRGTPFVQRQPTDESDLQVAYINVATRSYIL